MLALRASLTRLPTSWYASDDPCGGLAQCGIAHECGWAGVACRDSRVTDVTLPCMPGRCYNVGGVLPAALAGATALTTLDLRANLIGAPGGVAGSGGGYRARGCSGWPTAPPATGFAGGTLPPELGAMPRLQLVLLDMNLVGGPLPSNWSALQLATYISLQANKLTGTLPPEWGSLSALQLFDLGSNSLRGGFPEAWGRLTNVRVLNLESNNLEGALPQAWSGMTRLQRLNVCSMCAVCGAIPFVQGAGLAPAMACVEGRHAPLLAFPSAPPPRPAHTSPAAPPRLPTDVEVYSAGSSLTWPCGKSNCYKVPLGFVGQAVIIAGGWQVRGGAACTLPPLSVRLPSSSPLIAPPVPPVVPQQSSPCWPRYACAAAATWPATAPPAACGASARAGAASAGRMARRRAERRSPRSRPRRRCSW